MVKAWTFQTVIFFPPGRVAGTCRAKEQLDCSCGFGAKVLKVYEITNWKFQVNLQLTSLKALGWVQRNYHWVPLVSTVFHLGKQATWTTESTSHAHHSSGTRGEEYLQEMQGIYEVCNRHGVIPFQDWRGSGGSLFRQELGSNHSFNIYTMHLFLGSRFHRSSSVPPSISWGSACFTRSSAMTWCGIHYFWGSRHSTAGHQSALFGTHSM